MHKVMPGPLPSQGRTIADCHIRTLDNKGKKLLTLTHNSSILSHHGKHGLSLDFVVVYGEILNCEVLFKNNW